MIKKGILTGLNLFFIALFCLALFVFFSARPAWNIEEVVRDSALKEKKFGGKVAEITSDNGVKAWFMEEHDAPLVALSFYFDNAGYAFDDDDKQGLASFVSYMLPRRAGDFDEHGFQTLLETNAVKIRFDVADDIFEGALTFPKANVGKAADVLKLILTKPNTDEKNMEVVKRQQIAMIEMQNERPENVLRNEFRKRFFANHPKGRLAIGVKENVADFSKKDLLSFVLKNFGKDNLTVALVGDMTQDEAKRFLDDVFANLPNNGSHEIQAPVEAQYRMKEDNIERDIPQVISLFVAKGVVRSDADFYPLYIANEIFGGSGLSSRLNKRAREKEGLTYGAYTYLNTDKDAPRLMGTFSASYDNYEKMRSILLEEWQKMARKGVKKEEFESIRNNMLKSFNLRFDSLENISKQLLYMQKEHLEIDFLQKRNEYVSKTSFDVVNQAAKKYFANEPSILTIGHNNKRRD